MTVATSIGDAFEFIRNGKSVKQDKSSGGLPITRIETIANWTVDDRRVGYAGIEERGNEKWLLQPGDILFSHINSVEHIGKCALYEGHPEKLIHGMNLLALRPKPRILDSRYAYRTLSNPRFRATLQQFVNKAVNQASISTTNLKSLEIPLPPIEKQRRIAAILDKADVLRSKRKRAMELLDHLAQSTFLELFESPTTNEMTTIGSVCEVSSGSTPRREEEAHFGGSIPWVKTTEIKGVRISDTEERVTEAGIQDARLKVFPRETVLIAMYGQGATRGRVAILGIEATVNQACAALVPGARINPTFLFHQLKLNYERLRSLGRGGNQPNLNGQLIKNFEIFVPPIERQLKFVATVTKIEAQIQTMSASLDAIQTVVSSLQHRAFAGQL